MIPPEPAESFPPGAAGAPRRDLLSGLNDAQREAVLHGAGPLLVLAGAGSGKTRAITHRIAHLILERGVHPSRVVALTFTNKAAGEMRERVEALLGTERLGAWIGTFHSLCLRILRRDGRHVGLAAGFNIYDSDDQLAVVRRILKDEAGEDPPGTPRSFLSRISRAKNAMESPDEMEQRAFTPDRRLLARIYAAYEAALRGANAADFDDLLLRTLRLFREQGELARAYASRSEHLLVDEYQDTNRPQYLLVRALSAVHDNVCVVGDEDQCIYGFRGAELRNILEFEADHSGARIVRLEQNYRSTGTILDAAGSIIANNLRRKGKTLWTANPRGRPLELFRAPDDRHEAVWVARRIREFAADRPYETLAVLYRTNAQSRLIEEILRRDRIPYQVVGSVQFYARKEIKDLLAYLKLTANPRDDVSFRRVIGAPPRGIGAGTLAVLEDIGRATGMPLIEAAGHALEQQLLPARAAGPVRRFVDMLADFAARSADEPVPDLLQRFVEATGYEAYLNKSYGELATERMENVRGLISAAAEYVEESDEPATLEGFLDRSALVSDADEVGREPGVTLMTVHCAKGLEFPVVFLVGLEDNLFPHAMASANADDVEEERRLCYVAMTRARERLLLSHAHHRRFQGAFLPARPSRFLDEIPAELVEETRSAPAGFFDGPRERADPGGSSAARAAAVKPRRPAPAPPSGAGNAPAADGYSVGALVRHPSFGGGKIVDREGSGKHLKLTIAFGVHGTKKILPAYTKLLVQV